MAPQQRIKASNIARVHVRSSCIWRDIKQPQLEWELKRRFQCPFRVLVQHAGYPFLFFCLCAKHFRHRGIFHLCQLSQDCRILFASGVAWQTVIITACCVMVPVWNRIESEEKRGD